MQSAYACPCARPKLAVTTVVLLWVCVQDNFIPFYVFTAVRKFLVFLDPKKTGNELHRMLARCQRLLFPTTAQLAAGLGPSLLLPCLCPNTWCGRGVQAASPSTRSSGPR